MFIVRCECDGKTTYYAPAEGEYFTAESAGEWIGARPIVDPPQVWSVVAVETAEPE